MSNPDWGIARFQKAERREQFRQELGQDYKRQPICGDTNVCLGAVLGVSFLMALGAASIVIGR